MAAYAALVSVMQTIDQIQLHPRPPISLHQKQVASLTQIITFFQDFLEGYNPHLTFTAEADSLETRIADAAYEAEDVIKSHIADQILRQNISSIEFYQDLQKVIEQMDLIKMEVAKIKEKMRIQIKNDANSFISTSSTSTKASMVGFDDVLFQMLEKITRGQLDLQIISIVGMGGIGKTTLARNIYLDPLVEEHFDVCAWSTVSQEYNAREILRQVVDLVDNKDNENLSRYALGEKLYKYLTGMRYLVVMDDMWNFEAWDEVRRFFPDNENGSRIVITTRLSNLASKFNCSNRLDMKFLDEGSSWSMFSKTVFGEELCPIELDDIGKKIVAGCKGLPLSIAVIGGLLSKSARTRENWESIEGNLNSIVNLENNESCLQILYMSYNNLPVYLKPCFLYMGVFPEDGEIVVRILITLWVAEGFLKPFHGKSMEEIAEEYLEELVDRNILLVEKCNHFGKLKSCKIHDLLRDLSLREARKVKFLCVLGEQSIHHIPQDMHSQRRIRSTLSKYSTPLLQSLESTLFVRSLKGKFPKTLLYNYGLLKVSLLDISYFKEESMNYYEEIFPQLVNLRFFLLDDARYPLPRIPSSISHLWNLQTLIFCHVGYDYIWRFGRCVNLGMSWPIRVHFISPILLLTVIWMKSSWKTFSRYL